MKLVACKNCKRVDMIRKYQCSEAGKHCLVCDCCGNTSATANNVWDAEKNWNDKNEVLRGLKDHEIAMLVNHVTKQLNIKLAKARLPGCLRVLVSEAIVDFLKENNLKID